MRPIKIKLNPLLRGISLSLSPPLFILTFTLSIIPRPIPEVLHWITLQGLLDSLFHLFGFTLLGVFFRLALGRISSARLNQLAFLVVALWGILCESAQLFVSSRSFSILDLIANILGAPAALLLIRFLFS